jgi:hypothetical protein
MRPSFFALVSRLTFRPYGVSLTTDSDPQALKTCDRRPRAPGCHRNKGS